MLSELLLPLLLLPLSLARLAAVMADSIDSMGLDPTQEYTHGQGKAEKAWQLGACCLPQPEFSVE
jgi:hypothetical protein